MYLLWRRKISANWITTSTYLFLQPKWQIPIYFTGLYYQSWMIAHKEIIYNLFRSIHRKSNVSLNVIQYNYNDLWGSLKFFLRGKTGSTSWKNLFSKKEHWIACIWKRYIINIRKCSIAFLYYNLLRLSRPYVFQDICCEFFLAI